MRGGGGVRGGAGDTEVVFWFSLCGDEAAEQQPDPLRAGSGAKTQPFAVICCIQTGVCVCGRELYAAIPLSNHHWLRMTSPERDGGARI